jgi:hypothetical protein
MAAFEDSSSPSKKPSSESKKKQTAPGKLQSTNRESTKEKVHTTNKPVKRISKGKMQVAPDAEKSPRLPAKKRLSEDAKDLNNPSIMRKKIANKATETAKQGESEHNKSNTDSYAVLSKKIALAEKLIDEKGPSHKDYSKLQQKKEKYQALLEKSASEGSSDDPTEMAKQRDSELNKSNTDSCAVLSKKIALAEKMIEAKGVSHEDYSKLQKKKEKYQVMLEKSTSEGASGEATEMTKEREFEHSKSNSASNKSPTDPYAVLKKKLKKIDKMIEKGGLNLKLQKKHSSYISALEQTDEWNQEQKREQQRTKEIPQTSTTLSKKSSCTPPLKCGTVKERMAAFMPQRPSSVTVTPSPVRSKIKRMGSLKDKHVTATPSVRSKTKRVGSLKDMHNTFSSVAAKTTKSPHGSIKVVAATSEQSHVPSNPKQEARKQIKSTGGFLGEKKQDNTTNSPLEAAVALLKDASLSEQVRNLLNRIEGAGGFPPTRRLSVRDNDLVSKLSKAVMNDPSIKQISIIEDPRFEYLSKSLVVGFAEGLRANFYLQELCISGVELGNDFLSALATSLESNFILQVLDLSNNSFTNDALIEFCQAMIHNNSLKRVRLGTQYTAIFSNSQEVALEAFEKNETLQVFEVDFKSEDGPKQLSKILNRNKSTPKKTCDSDEQMLEFLKNEAERAEELQEQRKTEEEITILKDDDWEYLFKLSELFDRFKLDDGTTHQEDNAGGSQEDPKQRLLSGRSKSVLPAAFGNICAGPSRTKSACSTSSLGAGIDIPFTIPFTADGSFLTEDFISSYFVENPQCSSLTFDFCNQFKLFKRFPLTDPARCVIVTKFVGALLEHPRSAEITGINLANSCCGNDFFQVLSEKCFADDSMLPNLHLINAETNYISEAGVIALAKCIRNPTSFQYLQVLKLENQRFPVSSKAELALAKAMCVNRSIVRFSLRVRNLLERQQIDKYIQRNMDFLRQARRHHAIKTGTLQERKRNEMEQFFDRIAANVPEITEVKIVGNQRFLSLNAEEKIKAGLAFAKNTHVRTIQMSALRLDCKFAEAFAKSLGMNSSIEKVSLDSNAIAGGGLKALATALGYNSSIVEMQVRHQSKVTTSEIEDELADFLKENTKLIKFGVDLRSQMAKIKLDRKLAQNREIARKVRVQRNKSM